MGGPPIAYSVENTGTTYIALCETARFALCLLRDLSCSQCKECWASVDLEQPTVQLRAAVESARAAAAALAPGSGPSRRPPPAAGVDANWLAATLARVEAAEAKLAMRK